MYKCIQRLAFLFVTVCMAHLNYLSLSNYAFYAIMSMPCGCCTTFTNIISFAIGICQLFCCMPLFQIFILLSLRLWVMGGQMPNFTQQDNPAAFSPSLKSRYISDYKRLLQLLHYFKPGMDQICCINYQKLSSICCINDFLQYNN